MICRTSVFLFLLLCVCHNAMAQKPFTEGVITYNVTLESADHQQFTGTYIFTIKGSQLRKELKLNNGYQDVVLINYNTGDVHSLQARNGKKYAIQLKMEDLTGRQERYAGYTINNEQEDKHDIAGMAAWKGNVRYKDGSNTEVYYTKDWYPTQGVAYERFPDPKFLPLSFSYKDDNGMVMRMEASRVTPGPVENAVFRIPWDYKLISYKEYKELSK